VSGPGPGHNGGPTLAPGHGWRSYAWQRARRELLPKMPLEVVRVRVRRAQELGLDYRSYASIRAGTGRDVIAFLFSSNALRVTPHLVAMLAPEAEKLARLKAERLAAVHRPLDPGAVAGANAALIDAAARAPSLADGWAETRARLGELTAARGLPGDAVVVIGATALEAEWAAAGRLAAYLPREAFFGAA
jgi:hypothetical protein